MSYFDMKTILGEGNWELVGSKETSAPLLTIQKNINWGLSQNKGYWKRWILSVWPICMAGRISNHHISALLNTLWIAFFSSEVPDLFPFLLVQVILHLPVFGITISGWILCRYATKLDFLLLICFLLIWILVLLEGPWREQEFLLPDSWHLQ